MTAEKEARPSDSQREAGKRMRDGIFSWEVEKKRAFREAADVVAINPDALILLCQDGTVIRTDVALVSDSVQCLELLTRSNMHKHHVIKSRWSRGP